MRSSGFKWSSSNGFSQSFLWEPPILDLHLQIQTRPHWTKWSFQIYRQVEKTQVEYIIKAIQFLLSDNNAHSPEARVKNTLRIASSCSHGSTQLFSCMHSGCAPQQHQCQGNHQQLTSASSCSPEILPEASGHFRKLASCFACLY